MTLLEDRLPAGGVAVYLGSPRTSIVHATSRVWYLMTELEQAGTA